jgi:hypothetical protein
MEAAVGKSTAPKEPRLAQARLLSPLAIRFHFHQARQDFGAHGFTRMILTDQFYPGIFAT